MEGAMINQKNTPTLEINDSKNEKSDERKKFIRRPDLDVMTRLTIAFTAIIAMAEKQRGTITKLAKEYLISRTFVYMLANSLMEQSQTKFAEYCPPAFHEKSSLEHILFLRLEGKCSIEAISSFLKRFGFDNSSVGYISQLLNDIGSLLPSTQVFNEGDQVKVIFASDEIFAKNTPIMITVDPISTVILKIELLDKRTAENWIKHWETIEINGYIPIYLVCDGGTALAKAHEEHLPDLIKQLDTYHAVAHILGVIDKRLEKAACDAIEKEYASNVIIEGANFEESKIQRLIKRYEENQKKAQELIERYDSFHYLYISILKELELFDETGKLRDRQTAEENIETCLDLLETEMGYEKQVKKIRRFMGDLLNYFEVAEVIVEELLAKHPEISKEVLEAVCLAWQWGKKKVKAKESSRKRYCTEKEKYYYAAAEQKSSGKFDETKEKILKELDEIVQSSSIVECINSIVRPYINNTKAQINQELLNLIMFYHNHRRYKAGKREGKTPYEILTGQTQTKYWLDLLMEIYEEQQTLK
jgi:hypothetical protein